MNHNKRRNDRGTSLLELLVAVAASTILMAGLSLAVVLVSLANNHPLRSVHNAASEVSTLMAELQMAIRFGEHSPHAVEFLVADRNGDGSPETLRYAWSGNSGDPLTLAINAATPVIVVPAVHALDFHYTFQNDADTKPRVLLVVPDPANLSSQDTAKKARIELMGFPVQLISAAQPQADYVLAQLESDVAYISEEALSDTLTTKLRDSSLGVVNEERFLFDELGVASSSTAFIEQDTRITISNHPITAGLASTVTICQWPQLLAYAAGSVSPDAVALMEPPNGGGMVLITLERGDATYDGDTLRGRRVMLPWGGNSFDFQTLTPTAHTLLDRSLSWAAGDCLTTVDITLRTDASDRSEVVSRAVIFNQPRVSGPSS